MFGRLFDKLKKNRDNNISINNLNDTLLKVSDNLKNQNKKFALEKLLKLYTYIILQKLFDHIYKSYKSKTKGELIIFWNALKMNLLKKAEYSYGNKLSNEKKSISKKLTFSSKKKDNTPKNNINASIPYISLIPYLIKYLEGKIKERKEYFYEKLKTEYKNRKFCDLLLNYVNKKEKPNKEKFFGEFKKSGKLGESQKKVFKLFRRSYIRKLFVEIEDLSHLLKLMYLIKISIVNKEISEKRWIRVLIRKWRFITFSKNISKKKMESLYKQLHLNYLEMVNDVFGEEEQTNPSIIKEFERFGANVGMWENEHPGFI
jgi:hypothetical protein